MRLNEMRTYSAYKLSKKSREKLLEKFPPKYENIIAHHITVKFPSDVMPHPAKIQVVGHAAKDGVEAAVVSVNGKTTRSDGKVYHITISLENGKKPVQSNNLLMSGWKAIEPFDIDTTPELL